MCDTDDGGGRTEGMGNNKSRVDFTEESFQKGQKGLTQSQDGNL